MIYASKQRDMRQENTRYNVVNQKWDSPWEGCLLLLRNILLLIHEKLPHTTLDHHNNMELP